MGQVAIAVDRPCAIRHFQADLDVEHMYLAEMKLLEPRVIDTIEVPFVVPTPSKWTIAVEQAEAEMEFIKQLPTTQIPEALVELFAKYATPESLDDDFCGDETGMAGTSYFMVNDVPGPNRGIGLDREFIRAVMADAFIELGSGSYSVAYALGDSWIIKMNIADSEYQCGDDGGFDWAKACTEIQGNIFAPKIAALYQKDRLYCMVVERLAENLDLEAPDVGCFRDLAESHHADLNFGEYISELMEYQTFVMMAAINRDDLIQMSKVFDAVAVRTKGEGDLQDFNIMVRGKIPVINDPFGVSHSYELMQGKSFSWKMPA